MKSMPVEIENVPKPSATTGFADELRLFGRTIPHKSLFLILLAAWAALFHFFGNSTFSYVRSPSLFAWLKNIFDQSVDDQLGMYIPLVILGLLWWKREELSRIEKRTWWPGLFLFAAAVLMHVAGYLVQQARVSVAAFFIGIYAITGLLWGWDWLRSTFFPYFLIAFIMPSSNYAERLTLPLRLLATQITVFASHCLGIDVIREGTNIFERTGRFQYNVEAACSGLRSLTTMIALSCIFAFVKFDRKWKRALVVLMAFPLAIFGNSLRLLLIIVAAEFFGQSAGNYVHEHWLFSLVPYVPAMLGLAFLTRWLDEDNRDGKEAVS
jgi:exosortase